MKKVLMLTALLIVPTVSNAEIVEVPDRHLFHKHINHVKVHDAPKQRRIENNVGVKTDLIKMDKADITYKFTTDVSNAEFKHETLLETSLEDGLFQMLYKKVKGLIR